MQSRRIAMWSGPRNLSTAMLRAWGNRPDTFVVDEPLYAHYLLHSGVDHPGKEEVMATYDTDWRQVAAQLTGSVPEGRAIYYQKHMHHHLLPHIERDWILKLDNCFLIRDPSRVVTSLAKVLPEPTLEQTGFPQQVDLFRYIRQHTDKPPPVIDAQAVLEDPKQTLTRLCAALEVPFDDAMLHWPPGPRATDGLWGKYWYKAVEQSTGFTSPAPDLEVPERLLPLVDECRVFYEEMVGLAL